MCHLTGEVGLRTLRVGMPNPDTRRGRLADHLRWARALLLGRLWRIVVDGSSMVPTLHPGELVWCDADPHRADLRVGDIVVLGAVQSGQDDLEVKRISALPGMRSIREGSVPVGSCEVLGDNGGHSADSRTYGAIPLASVRARVLFATAHGRLRAR